MRHLVMLLSAVALSATVTLAAGVPNAIHGTVQKIDNGAKTMVVKTADGTEHTFHYVGTTAVHGAEAAGAGTVDGLAVGTDVAVHYTKTGTVDTAHEIDRLGEGGLKAVDGTVTGIDRGAKTLTIKTADGAEQTFHLADRAARDSATDVSKGVGKSTKVTVYYSEKTGEKLAHFFEKSV